MLICNDCDKVRVELKCSCPDCSLCSKHAKEYYDDENDTVEVEMFIDAYNMSVLSTVDGDF